MEAFMGFPSFLFETPVRQESTPLKDFEFMYGDDELRDWGYDEFGKSARIIELTDTGCDACALEITEKNKSPDEVSKYQDNVPRKENICFQPLRESKTRRSRAYKGKGLFDSSSDDSSKNNPSPEDVDVVKNSVHFKNIFDAPNNRKNENLRGADVVNDRKRFTDRGVDAADRMPPKISETAKFSPRRSGEFLESVGNEKRDEKAVPRYESFSEKKKSRTFAGSKLPVWHGTSSKISGKQDRDGPDGSLRTRDKKRSENLPNKRNNPESLAMKKPNEHPRVDKTSVEPEREARRTEGIPGNVGKQKIDALREMCPTSERSEKIAIAPSYSSHVTNVVSADIEKAPKTLSSARSQEAREKSSKDQSRSELWNEDYERAYAKGRSVGLRIFRMAKAARDERKREFRKYGFENYNQTPKKMPQEILDIGVSLVEKVVDEPDVEDRVTDDEFPAFDIPEIILQAYLTAQLFHE